MDPATLLITSDRGRVNLLARAERSLPAGWVLVQCKELVGRRRAFRTRPASKQAQLAAEEPPLVMRGGLTSIIRYYLVPATELGAVEEHFEGGEFSHSYDVQLRVACRGKREILARPA